MTTGNVAHIVGWWQHLLDWLGLKVPRALCGQSLEGAPDGSDDPGPSAPVCPQCAALAGAR